MAARLGVCNRQGCVGGWAVLDWARRRRFSLMVLFSHSSLAQAPRLRFRGRVCWSRSWAHLLPLLFVSARSATVTIQYPFTGSDLSTLNPTLSAASVTATALADQATGTGALGLANTHNQNRVYLANVAANVLWVSANRESDAQTPIAAGGNSETTWVAFSVCPATGWKLDFSTGTLSITTHALSTLGGTSVTSGDWAIYHAIGGSAPFFSTSGQTVRVGSTQAGASVTGSGQGTAQLQWSLSGVGEASACVDILLDVVACTCRPCSRMCSLR